MFEPIQKFLNKAAHQNNIHRQLEAAQICDTARSILKTEFANLSESLLVRSFKNKTLFMHSTNSTASQEMFYSKQKYIDAVNRKLGKKIVEKVSLTLKQKSLD